ncbi:MAG: FAD binding domain-containing protein, partial [Thermoplasmatota archaeon]
MLSRLGDRGKVLAGGHSLVPIMKLRLSQPEVLVDIGRIGELRYVRADGDQIARDAGCGFVRFDVADEEATVAALEDAAAQAGGALDVLRGLHLHQPGAGGPDRVVVAIAMGLLQDDLVLHALRVGQAADLLLVAPGDAGRRSQEERRRRAGRHERRLPP